VKTRRLMGASPRSRAKIGRGRRDSIVDGVSACSESSAAGSGEHGSRRHPAIWWPSKTKSAQPPAAILVKKTPGTVVVTTKGHNSALWLCVSATYSGTYCIP